MSTLKDLEAVGAELREDAAPHLGAGWSLHRKHQADTVAAFVKAQRERDAAGVKVPPRTSYGMNETVNTDFCDGWNECLIEVLRLNMAVKEST